MKYSWIDAYLLSKRGVTKDLQADWNWVRYRIGDKMFAAVCLDREDKPYYITIKLTPETGEFLRQQYEDMLEKKRLIRKEIQRLKSVVIGASKRNQEFLERNGSSPLKTATNLAELMCRPELSYELLGEIDEGREELPDNVIEQVQIEIKYEGYIDRQLRQVEQFKKMERRKIPSDLNYDDVPSLRIEARQKLKLFHPVSMGQASRISGVSPADISVLMVYLEQFKRKKEVTIE